MNRASLGRSVLAPLAVLLLVGACSASGTASSAPASSAPTQPAGGSASVDPGPSVGAGGSVDPGTGDGTDYCAVFTLDRLAAIVGQPVHLGDQSMLFGQGCRWDTADGKGGVVIQRMDMQLGFGDIATQDGQHPLAGVGDQATIGPGAFADAAGDLHTGTLAAAIVNQGFASVTVAPRPSDEVVIGLLRDLIAATP
jgi:hypothetical protein